MNIVIHIGTEKTGTTSIQEFLYLNRERLIEKGFYFPQVPGERNNRKLPSYCIRSHRWDDYLSENHINTESEREAFKNKFEKEFIGEITSLPAHIHTVVLSSEHFHSRCIFEDELQTLKSLLSPYFDEIRVVTYLRPQVDVAVSLYSTALKTGGVPKEIDTFVEEKCNLENPYYNYQKYLELWAQVFGRKSLIVRRFGKRYFVDNELIADFLDAVGISCGSDDAAWALPEKKNESLQYFGQEVLKLLNRKIPRFEKGKGFNAVNTQVHQLIVEKFTGEGALPGYELVVRVQSEFDESNENVRKAWFPDSDKLFYQDFSKYKRNTEQLDAGVLDFVGRLFALLEAKVHNEDIDVIRDAAITLEEHDVSLAFRLMKLAARLRPGGPLIKAKLGEYSKLVN